jgi:hypothetical protein
MAGVNNPPAKMSQTKSPGQKVRDALRDIRHAVRAEAFQALADKPSKPRKKAKSGQDGEDARGDRKADNSARSETAEEQLHVGATHRRHEQVPHGAGSARASLQVGARRTRRQYGLARADLVAEIVKQVFRR